MICHPSAPSARPAELRQTSGLMYNLLPSFSRIPDIYVLIL